jgi:hypothetical protein
VSAPGQSSSARPTTGVLLRSAEPHHFLDSCAVLPGPVEQHHLAAGGQVRNVALEVLLVLFAGLPALRDRLPVDRIRYHEQRGAVHVYPLLPAPAGRAARRALIAHINAALNESRPGATPRQWSRPGRRRKIWTPAAPRINDPTATAVAIA